MDHRLAPSGYDLADVLVHFMGQNNCTAEGPLWPSAGFLAMLRQFGASPSSSRPRGPKLCRPLRSDPPRTGF
eukprot:8686053-Alexandrium_andersonii.AAC.1